MSKCVTFRTYKSAPLFARSLSYQSEHLHRTWSFCSLPFSLFT